ncbi:hypothetical protein BK658_22440 [Pseudomonas brassicacearum]|uniref:Uncharacterized protein n=1 Tax=Pseudomonas brassicacearum TaxID=930166 RepID=A0A423GLT1_9PSED|nr:hypothetical protein BK658_22440 [Pseudomonas brassicacearum]
MASHDETTVPAASLYDGKAGERVGICRPSSIVFLPVYVLVLVVSFAEFQNSPAEPWTIVMRGILNTSAEGS